jgi:endonuclease/exonuclease/phosphatase family metal-dependent hydrolase
LRSEVESLAAYCGFTYELVYRPFLDAAVAETDEEVILSRYPVLQAQLQLLHSALYDEPGGFRIFARHLLFARLDHPAGPVDVYTTHLSSGADDATNSCNSSSEFAPGVGPRIPCPVACNADDTVRACQARQLALFVEQTRLPAALVLVSGDFNAKPGSAEYLEMTGRGWLDTHLAAGSAECDAQSGLGCTSGRNAEDGDLERPGRNVKKRIDYIFADPPANCELDSAGVLDVAPNPFVASCGPEPAAICWMSDHSATSVRFTCR